MSIPEIPRTLGASWSDRPEAFAGFDTLMLLARRWIRRELPRVVPAPVPTSDTIRCCGGPRRLMKLLFSEASSQLL